LQGKTAADPGGQWGAIFPSYFDTLKIFLSILTAGITGNIYRYRPSFATSLYPPLRKILNVKNAAFTLTG